MKIPDPQHTIAAAIDAAHEAKRASHSEVFRPHMGASTLGEKCDRKLWLGFRWAVRENFPGRILRVFRRGQNEEATVVEAQNPNLDISPSSLLSYLLLDT